jgi:uncharacterized protein
MTNTTQDSTAPGRAAIDLAERFFRAIEQGDMQTVRDIYAPDVVVWHNYDALDERHRGQNREESLAVIAGIPARIRGARYDVWHRETTETGFVQQHVLRGTMPNGEEFVLPACIVASIRDDRIVRLDEYFDPAIRAHLWAVLRAAEEVRKST